MDLTSVATPASEPKEIKVEDTKDRLVDGGVRWC